MAIHCLYPSFGRASTLIDQPSVEIKLTPEFQRKIRNLAKKYRKIRLDLQPVLEQLQIGIFPGNRLSGIDAEVLKLRVKNSDIQKGKSGGYRLIYWIVSPNTVVLLDMYSKSEQEDIEIPEILRVIANFKNE
jgi:mRNA-degrading endonuclease RelE of RelBE toxin-antitoxin system